MVSVGNYDYMRRISAKLKKNAFLSIIETFQNQYLAISRRNSDYLNIFPVTWYF